MSDYPAFKKIPRFNREITITEKIDGTNGLISIERYAGIDPTRGVVVPANSEVVYTTVAEGYVDAYIVKAGSRNRWLGFTKQTDNMGFAQWVQDNARVLAEGLGEGLHYGEWWGNGIQRGYGLEKGDKRFSLFNVGRWNADTLPDVPGLGVVPTLATTNGAWLHTEVSTVLKSLRDRGSAAVPGFDKPEGLVLYHTQSKQNYKILLEGDDISKAAAGILRSEHDTVAA